MTQAAENMNSDFEAHFFDRHLQDADPDLFKAVEEELDRQKSQIELIASENIVSRAVMEAQGSVLTNKYAEGYPGKRYYGGCEFVDIAENLAIERACELFECSYANVQPHSGSQANQAVYFALLQPGDKVLGMSLDHGGHLTHGHPVNQSGKWFDFVSYGVSKDDQMIDMEQVESLAKEHKPKMIVCGASAYSRAIDFKRFREIADDIGAFLFIDMAHYAGLVAAGVYPSPIEHAHVVTTTTHKTLRGPRGGMILSDDADVSKKLNKAVFPGWQGGPLMHVIAAKAVAFGEALKPEFKAYAKRIVENAEMLANTMEENGYNIVSGGTDSHVMLVDLQAKELTGKDAEASLDRAGLTTNKNTIPFDPQSPFVTSGIRLGTPAGTTRGFGQAEFRQIGEMICEVLNGLAENGLDDNGDVEASVRQKVQALCDRFPIYQDI